MTENIPLRQLTAVFAADVVGFTNMVEQDETGTLATFRLHYDDVFAPAFVRHRGRLVKLIGDGILAQFASAVDAVSCAYEVQNELTDRNAILPLDRQMVFRIGINVGDILIDGDDIQGDGVVVASRLEAAADPGGIVVSNSVHEQVFGKLDFRFERLGEKRLKGLSRPIGVYRAVLPGSNIRSERRFDGWKIVGAAFSVLLLCAVFYYVSTDHSRWLESSLLRPDDKNSPPAEASIAVLPFTNFSGDPEQDLFVAGMTADLITDLSGISGLFVIARNSSFAFASDAEDLTAVATDLGVRYVLVGSVRRNGNQLRINTNLIDSKTGEQLWAERYDDTLDDIFALQDRVTARVVDELAVTLTAQESQHLARHGTADPAAYEAFLRGNEKLRQLTPQALGDAREYLKLSVDLDPDFSRAHAALAMAYYRGFETGWSHEAFGLGYNVSRLRAGSHMAKAWAEPSAIAHRVASEMFLRVARTEEALEHAKSALEMEPNDPENLSAVAVAMIFLGRSNEAHEYIDKALRLDSIYPSHYYYLRGLAHFSGEEFGKAEVALNSSLKANPDNFRAFAVLAATQIYLEKTENARENMTRYFDRDDAWSHRGRRSEGAIWEIWPFTHRSDWQRYFEALTIAGDQSMPNYDSRGIFPPLRN